jgi:O-antigen ligase
MLKRVKNFFQQIPLLNSAEKTAGAKQLNTPVIASILSTLTKISLAGTVLFIPFRFRVTLFEQPISPIFGDYTNGLLFLSDAFMLITLVGWGICLILKPHRVTLGPLVITLPLVGLLLVSLVSVFVSMNRIVSTYSYIRLILLAGLYLYIVNEVIEFKYIVYSLATAVAIQGAVGISQVLLQRSIGLQALGEYELNPSWQGVSIVWAQGVRSLRAYGLSDHPNILGGCLAFALVILIAWYVKENHSNGSVLLAAILLGLSGLLFTFSRSAWLAFLIGMIVIVGFLFFLQRYPSLQNLLGLALASAIVLIPFLIYSAPYLGVRLNRSSSFEQVETETQSLKERAALFAAGNEIFVSHALTGVGLGASPIALMRSKPVFPYYYQPPHNTFLDAAVETGIFGAMFYGLLLVGPWFALFLRRKRLQFTPAFLGVIGAMAAITVVGVVDYYPWLLTPGRLWQFTIWGFWGSFYSSSLKAV